MGTNKKINFDLEEFTRQERLAASLRKLYNCQQPSSPVEAFNIDFDQYNLDQYNAEPSDHNPYPWQDNIHGQQRVLELKKTCSYQMNNRTHYIELKLTKSYSMINQAH